VIRSRDYPEVLEEQREMMALFPDDYDEEKVARINASVMRYVDAFMVTPGEDIGETADVVSHSARNGQDGDSLLSYATTAVAEDGSDAGRHGQRTWSSASTCVPDYGSLRGRSYRR
jgi:hypothetical protein